MTCLVLLLLLPNHCIHSTYTIELFVCVCICCFSFLTMSVFQTNDWYSSSVCGMTEDSPNWSLSTCAVYIDFSRLRFRKDTRSALSLQTFKVLTTQSKASFRSYSFYRTPPHIPHIQTQTSTCRPLGSWHEWELNFNSV